VLGPHIGTALPAPLATSAISAQSSILFIADLIEKDAAPALQAGSLA
jgi:hypothetical protein